MQKSAHTAEISTDSTGNYYFYVHAVEEILLDKICH